jgi:hypothetical protein
MCGKGGYLLLLPESSKKAPALGPGNAWFLALASVNGKRVMAGSSAMATDGLLTQLYLVDLSTCLCWGVILFDL